MNGVESVGIPPNRRNLRMFAQNDSNSPEADSSEAPSTAGKRLFGVGMLAVGIAAGAMFAPAGFAGAQEDGDDATEADDTETETGRKGHRNQSGEVLESLGIDADAIQAGRDADQSLAQIAEANGVSEADLIAAIEAGIETRVAEAVESGRITQEAADEKLAELSDKISERVNTLPSERAERGNRRSAQGAEVLEELGLTVEDIQAGNEAGQSLAETAAANGVSEADLVDALVAQATERAEAAVENGRIDGDRAAELLDGLDERITERVNAEPGDRPERGQRGFRGQRGNGPQGDTEETVGSF